MTLLFLKVVKSQLVGAGEGTVKRLYRAIPSLNKNLSTSSFFLEGGGRYEGGRGPAVGDCIEDENLHTYSTVVIIKGICVKVLTDHFN